MRSLIITYSYLELLEQGSCSTRQKNQPIEYAGLVQFYG